ncbi:purine nucleoside permease-domain-containing protein [Apiospora kogelbergensis]|uniref:purine nucleoside permease-domain-containing protein n=1 Tax=Apiospora kogelbergensis TaxID=1337665 RepID=UPI00312DDEE0
MRLISKSALAAAYLCVATVAATYNGRIKPKVMIMTFFDAEGEIYLTKSNATGALDFRGMRHRVPYASPEFPDLHCTADGDACLMTTGEAEIQATATTMALLADPQLDLGETYWVLTGVGGGAPDQVTLGAITLARFTIQVGMSYEMDARELPPGFDTGYVPQGTVSPEAAWGSVYNSEVFEVNAALRDAFTAMIDPARVADSAAAAAYRAHYAGVPRFAPGAAAPAVHHCDSATSDTWHTGALLAETHAKRVDLWTNGTGTYCTTAQEDGAVLGALVRGALEDRVDFARVAIVRTVSDFDRPYPGQSVMDNLVNGTAGYPIAIENVWVAGDSIARGIINCWNETFRAGIPAQNYVGDVWGVLGGTPDFGPGRVSGGKPVVLPGAKGQQLGRKAKRGMRRSRFQK